MIFNLSLQGDLLCWLICSGDDVDITSPGSSFTLVIALGWFSVLLIVRAVADEALAATLGPLDAEGVPVLNQGLGHTLIPTLFSAIAGTKILWYSSIPCVLPASFIFDLENNIHVSAVIFAWWRSIKDRALRLFKSLEMAVSKRGAAAASHYLIVSFLTVIWASLVGLISPAGILVVGGGRHGAFSFADIAACAVSCLQGLQHFPSFLAATSSFHDGIISPLTTSTLLVSLVGPAGGPVIWGRWVAAVPWGTTIDSQSFRSRGWEKSNKSKFHFCRKFG